MVRIAVLHMLDVHNLNVCVPFDNSVDGFIVASCPGESRPE